MNLMMNETFKYNLTMFNPNLREGIGKIDVIMSDVS